eukprot:scaffold209304_cov32-Tisochrysis_lutea.AAC.2
MRRTASRRHECTGGRSAILAYTHPTASPCASHLNNSHTFTHNGPRCQPYLSRSELRRPQLTT